MGNTKDEQPSHFRSNHRSLLIAMAIAASLVIGSMVYVLFLDNHISKTHTEFAHTTEHMISDMSHAHLWLEEVLAGDESHSPQQIYGHLNHIKRDFHKLEHLSAHNHSMLSHSNIDQLSSLNQQAQHTFHALFNATKLRLSDPEISGSGSILDQNYDKLAAQFDEQIHAIGWHLQSSLTEHLEDLKNNEALMIILSAMIMMGMIWLVISFSKKQQQQFELLLDAEQEQHLMEGKYRALIEQSPLATQIMATDGTLTKVNKAWEELWGFPFSALNDYNILQDKQLEEKGVLSYVKRGISGEALSIPVINYDPEKSPNIDKPGRSRFVRTHIYPLKNTKGEVYQVVLTHEDVTEGYLQSIFQTGQNDILKKIADPSISLEDTLTALTLFIEELSPKMIASILLLDDSGCHLIDGVGPSLPSGYLDAIQGMAIGPDVGSCGTAAYTKERVVVSDISKDPLWKDFKEIALDFNLHACWSQPIKDSIGNVVGTFALYHNQPCKPSSFDIALIKSASELARNAIVHKKNIAKIIDSEAQLLEAQKLAKIGSWELNLETDTLKWSDEIFRIFEIDQNKFDASYEAFLNAIHPEDRARVHQAYTNSLETKKPYDITHRLLMEDGRIKHVNERCETFFGYQGKPYKSVGTVQDITKSVEEQLEKENIQTKMEHVQRLESLGVLAGGIAHDFNNILTAILGNAGLAQSKLPATSPIHGYINSITQASHKAADLCKQMLAYSGKGKFIIKPILLADLIEELSQLLHVTIAKNVVLRLDLSKQTPAIDADVTQMQQVIMNLVINASEAIGENSGSISISTGVMRVDQQYLASTYLEENLEDGQYVYLEVSDTGCGMDEETQKRIFEPFFTTKFTGRGLGMAAILGIVRGHHGAIKTYSEINKGTTFKVLFPCSKQQAISLSPQNDSGLHYQGKGSVLVIDDEETIREVAASMLKDMGLKALLAADGVEGIEVFEQHYQDITVVLLDMTMPRMGGEDTFTELCRINPNVKVILSSGYNEQDATNRFAGKGLAGFLQKPYTPQQLSEKLADILDKT